jgi:hypothetical protein
VDAKVAEALNVVAAPDIQLLPLKVDGADAPYFVLNITTVARCVDESSSEFTTFDAEDPFGRGGKYRMVTTLAIDKTLVAGCQILRIHDWLTPVIASEQVCDLLGSFGIPGLLFQEV